MSNAATRWLRTRRFDTDAAVLGLLLALALAPLRLLASDIYVETIPIVLGLACVLYLLAARNGQVSTPTLSTPVTYALPPLVVVAAAAMVVVAVVHGERSLLFYDVAGVAGTMLLLQVLFAREESFEPALLLGQVLLLAAVVRFAGLYTSASLVGIDVWTHHRLAGMILEAGSIDAIANDKHYAAPLYHVLLVSTSLLADVTLGTAVTLTVGLAMPVAVLFVYSTTKLLVPERWAVFAATIYSFGDYVIEWGLHLIPTSQGLVLYLCVVYLLVRITQARYRTRDFLLLVLVSVAIVLTHQVSSFILLVLLAAGVAAQVVLRSDLFEASPLGLDAFRRIRPVNLVGLGVFDFGLTVFMWSLTPYRGDTFLETILSFLAETVASSAGFMNLADPSSTGAGGAVADGPTLMQQVAMYVDTVGFLLLLCATIVGCLYVLRRHRAKHATYTLVFATTAMLVFVLGLPLFGIRNFIPQRWFAFLYVPMAILSAIGVRFLARRLNRRLFVAFLLVFSLAYPAVMVMSSNGAIDSPAFSDERARLSYTESEVAAVRTIGSMSGSPDDVPPERMLYTDHPYQTVFTRTGAYPADPAMIVDGEPVDHDVVVYRRYQSRGASFFLDEDENGRILDLPPERLCDGRSTLYSNGDVRLCVSGG